MRRWLWFGIILMAGCTTVQPPAHTPPPLPLLAEPVVEEAPAQELPAAERNLLMDSEPYWPAENPVTVVAKAAKRATVTPSSVGFERGMLVYPYRPYSVYRVDVPFRGSLHIQLQPGESIRLVAGLRKEEWMIQRDDAATSLEASHLAVTATEANLQGRLMIVTSTTSTERVYYLDVHSQESQGLYGVSWRHPPKVSR
jgi:type IV secretory pathway VirB9-like protein